MGGARAHVSLLPPPFGADPTPGRPSRTSGERPRKGSEDTLVNVHPFYAKWEVSGLRRPEIKNEWHKERKKERRKERNTERKEDKQEDKRKERTTQKAKPGPVLGCVTRGD